MIDFNRKLDAGIEKLSISTALSTLMTPFDSKGVAAKTCEKHYNNPNSEYYHMSVDEILDAWSAKGAKSTHYGSMLDDYIGCILTGTEDDLKLFKMDNGYDYDERLHSLCDSFDNFYSVLCKSGDTKFIAREQWVNLKVENPDATGEDDKYVNMYGRFDALFKNERTGKYILIDWKSSGTIDKVASKYTNKMFGPMYRYPQLNWYQYTLQLYFYKQALIEGKYLPDGITENDIIVMIVNLPGKMIEETKTNYQIHSGAIPYDPVLMTNFYKFAIQKTHILKKKTEIEDKELTKEENKQEIKSENLESLF